VFIKKSDVKKLSDNVRQLNAGQNIDIRDNREGVWSALKNDIQTLSARLNEQAESLRREKLGMTTALADISHQIKTPLTSALMMSELLQNPHLPDDKRSEFLQSLQASLEHTERLVLSLLKLAKLDSGATEFNRENVSASSLINSALTPLTAIIEARTQTVSLSVINSTDILCDETWTSEALTNIIKNASEHAGEGGEIRVESGENSLYSWISVSDSGAGFTHDELPRLFERFRSTTKQGVGIGLNMAMSIMREQGGDIEVALPNTFILKFYL